MVMQYLFRHIVRGEWTKWKDCNAPAITHMEGFGPKFKFEFKENEYWMAS